MIKGKDIVVWFSCGAASAVAAKVTLEKYGKDNNVRRGKRPMLSEGCLRENSIKVNRKNSILPTVGTTVLVLIPHCNQVVG